MLVVDAAVDASHSWARLGCSVGLGYSDTTQRGYPNWLGFDTRLLRLA
jgi:hypothetical protein